MTKKSGQSRKSLASICFITSEFSPFPGGIATYAVNVRDAVSGVVPVYTIAPSYPDRIPDDKNIARVLAHHSLSARSIFRAILVVLKRDRNCLIHAADIRSGLIAFVVRILTGRRYVVTVHGSEVAKLNRFRPAHLPIWMMYRAAERVIANSYATKALVDSGVRLKAPCVVAHLGVDEKWFESPAAEFEDAELKAIGGLERIVCTVGRIEARKGHLLAIEVLAALQAKWGAGRLVYVIGGKVIDPAFAAEIRRYAATVGVRIIMPGRLTDADVRRLYSVSLAQLLLAQPIAGKIEGFGLVILEAAAQGCPTVATRVGGIPEVIDAGVTGYLAEPDDVSGLAAGLAWILDLPDRGVISANCRAHARTFSWESCARQTYAGLVEGSQCIQSPLGHVAR